MSVAFDELIFFSSTKTSWANFKDVLEAFLNDEICFLFVVKDEE